MINLDDLTIRQARALAAQFSAAANGNAATRVEHGLQIAVLDRGFIYVGHVATDGEWCYIANAWNIRRWGTSRGLGELANGPLPDTKLDPVGSVRMPLRTLQHMIAAEVNGWTSKLV